MLVVIFSFILYDQVPIWIIPLRITLITVSDTAINLSEVPLKAVRNPDVSLSGSTLAICSESR